MASSAAPSAVPATVDTPADQSALKIHKVDIVDSSEVRCKLRRPLPGETSQELAIEIFGSVAVRRARIKSIEVVCEGRVCREVDASAHISKGQKPRSTGVSKRVRFHTTVGAFRLPQRFRLSLRARLEDERRVLVARISGERERLTPEAGGELQPILISTPSGRTGTSWAVDLLGHHPAIVAYPPVGVEPRVAAYWLDVAATLTEPQSYVRMLRPQISRRGDKWWVGEGAEPSRDRVKDDAIRSYLGRENVRQIATWTRMQIDGFYRAVAEDQGKQATEAFVEKAPLDRALLHTLVDLFPGMREILLFRDPRDTLCSILAYKERNPAAAFHGDSPSTDDAYLRRLRRSFRVRLWQAKQSPWAMIVRYEDLVRNPVATLEAILTHVGLDPSPEAIAQMLEGTAADHERLADHRTSDTAERSIGRWRRDMDASLQARTTDVFQSVLRQLRY